MRQLLCNISFLLLVQSVFGQHENLINNIPSSKIFEIEQGDRIEFRLIKFDYPIDLNIPGNAGNYLVDKNKDRDVLLFTNQKTGTVVNMDITTVFGSFTRQVFNGESGNYTIQFNLKNAPPKVNVAGTIFILNKKIHRERNFYNRVAKGTLTRCHGDTFVDENGCQWELQSNCASIYHNPARNKKFLHRNIGGGEYETIRSINLPSEGINKQEKCPVFDSPYLKGFTVIELTSDILKGPNVLDSPNLGTYNFGETSAMSTLFGSHKFLDIDPHEEWGNDYKGFGEIFLTGCNPLSFISTLFLIDVSGSMSQNGKFLQAIQATSNTISTIQQEAQQSCLMPEIEIMVFSGNCISDPTTIIQPFSKDLDIVKSSVNKIPAPYGETPLPQAIERAKVSLQSQLAKTKQSCGNLIILGDGQSSCGDIRPPSVYVGMQTKSICSQKQGGNNLNNVTFYTIGFGIQAGSVAERDLQYLANSSGGKYFNAQNQYELTRSFQKINRIYTPISFPQTLNVDTNSDNLFSSAYGYVFTQQYDTALTLYKKFTASYPNDSAGLYNYALMCEANERYKTAVKYYELYLQHAPNDPNKTFLLERIATLRKDYDLLLAYNKQLIRSDLAYLEQHFKELENTPDAVPLAGEFTGFIQEKQSFYKSLPDILEMEDPWLKQYAKEISQALKEATYFLSKNPKRWDLDGISMIGNVYAPLDRLTTKLGK